MHFRFSPRFAAAAASALLLASCAATSSEAPGAARAEARAEVEDGADQRVECRMVGRSESRMRRERVCRTAEEWREIQRDGF